MSECPHSSHRQSNRVPGCGRHQLSDIPRWGCRSQIQRNTTERKRSPRPTFTVGKLLINCCGSPILAASYSSSTVYWTAPPNLRIPLFYRQRLSKRNHDLVYVVSRYPRNAPNEIDPKLRKGLKKIKKM